MSNSKWLIVCVVCFVLGAGVCYLAQSGQRQAGRSAIQQARSMEGLVEAVGDTLTEFADYRDRATEWIEYLERNNIEISRIITELRANQSELEIRYRELEAGLADVAGQLPIVTTDVSSVADDIDAVIQDAESGAGAEGD